MNYLIVVAGGSGLRMGSDVPKQFLLLHQQPVLIHTLRRFQEAIPGIKTILVLPDTQIPYWNILWEKLGFVMDLTVVSGGRERYHSVQNGLVALKNQDPEGIVAVHDGVRPLVSVSTILETYQAAKTYGAAIPVMPVNESIRKVSGQHSEAVQRKDYCLVQTPQCFKLEILRKAYSLEFDEAFTDDASVAERAGFPIYLTQGNQENIKITNPADLKIAELFMQN